MKKSIPPNEASNSRDDLEHDVRDAIQKITVASNLNLSPQRQDEILEKAWAEFSKSKKRLRTNTRNKTARLFGKKIWMTGLGALGAVAITAAIFIQPNLTKKIEEEAIHPALAEYDPADLNQDGVVDIADAWIMSQRLRLGSRELALDVNGDSVFDHQDVNWTLARIVRIDG